MKIGFITPYYPPKIKGGMEISLSLLVGALVEKGHQVNIYTLNYEKKDLFEKGNPMVFRFRWGKDSVFRKTNPLVVKKFVNRVLAIKPHLDILDAYSWFFPAPMIAKSLKIPYVLSIRDATPVCDVRVEKKPRYHPLFDYFNLRLRHYGFSPFQLIYGVYGFYLNKKNISLIKKAPAMTYASEALAKVFQPYNKNIYIINSIAKRFKFKKKIKIKGIDFKKDKVYVYAGRLSEGKGALVCFKTAQVLCRNPEVKFLFIGSGKHFKPKNNCIKFLGRLSHRKTLNIISQSFAVIVPSQIFEAFPRVAIEAISSGIPVIGTNVGGIPEAIGKAGIIIEPGSVQNIFDTCLKLINNKGLYQELKKETKKQAEKFSEANISKKVLRAYDKLLKG